MEGRTKEVLNYKSSGISLKSGQEIRVPIIVDKTPVSVLHFEFLTRSSNVAFSVYFFGDNGAKKVLLAPTYPKEDGSAVTGSIPVRGFGRVELAWDNATTWLRRRNSLSYSVKLEYKDVDKSGRLVMHGNERIFPAQSPSPSDIHHTGRQLPAPRGGADVAQQARPATRLNRPRPPNVDTKGAPAAEPTIAAAAATTTTTTTTTANCTALEKVELIFRHFDKDGDDLLGYHEMDQLMRTVSVPPRTLEYSQWVEVCHYWRAHPEQGLTLEALTKIYASSPGSIEEEFQRYLQVVQHGTDAIQYIPCPPGWVEVDREDGSSYYMNYADMSKTIEARPPRSPALAGTLQKLPSFDEQCVLVFEFFDKDGNGFIDLDEMNKYTLAVDGEKGVVLNVDTWVRIASMLNETAELGISLASFRSMYSTQSAADRDLRRDYTFVTEQLRLARTMQEQSASASASAAQEALPAEPNQGPEAASKTSADVPQAAGAAETGEAGTTPAAAASGPAPAKPRRKSQSTSPAPKSHLRCADPWSKCQYIFAYFDKDGDGLLNFEEMRAFTATTEGEDGILSRSTWDTLCERKDVDPDLGFACEDLFQIYHVAVDKDMARVFPSDKPPAENMNLHAKIMQIFEEFDEDRDNYMNLEEMNAFTAVTEGPEEQLSRDEWEHTCRRMLIDPDIGLAFNDLATIYTAHLDKDFETVVEAKRLARRKRAREKAQKELQERLWQEQAHGLP